METAQVSLIERAENLATSSHKGQKRWDRKTEYIEHPRAVVRYAFRSNFAKQVGWLHDVIEDCGCDSPDIKVIRVRRGCNRQR